MKEVDGLGFRKRNFKEGASLHHINDSVKKRGQRVKRDEGCVMLMYNVWKKIKIRA